MKSLAFVFIFSLIHLMHLSVRMYKRRRSHLSEHRSHYFSHQITYIHVFGKLGRSHLCFYRPQRSCGQGYVFTRVCDSVNTGGCLPQCMLGPSPLGVDTPLGADNPPGADTPWEQNSLEQTLPWEQTPPSSRHPPRSRHPQSRHPQEQTPPWSRHPSQGADTPPEADTPQSRHKLPQEQTPQEHTPPEHTPPEHPPPGKQNLAYGQWAAGTHPTGMHSCF